MTNRSAIDEIIKKVSIKFNRIFYDREFIECVFEDLHKIIENQKTCCVLVFPVLNPNYLRVVRYQAQLLDLAVISIGSGCARSIGICQKKFMLLIPDSETIPSNPLTMTESVPRRQKRPAMQHYVPPALRKRQDSGATETHTAKNKLISNNNKRNANRSNSVVTKQNKCCLIKQTKNGVLQQKKTSESIQIEKKQCTYFSVNDIRLFQNCHFNDVDNSPSVNLFIYDNSAQIMPLIDWKLSKVENLSNKRTVLIKDEDYLANTSLVGRHFVKASNKIVTKNVISQQFSCLLDQNMENSNLYFICDEHIRCNIPNKYFFNDFEIENYKRKLEIEAVDILSLPEQTTPVPYDIEMVKITDTSPEKGPVCLNEVATAERSSLKNVIENNETNDTINKKQKENDHEQEKEIMRQTKQNINRKTRSIIKYVEDDIDTLQIDKDYNVNNWEDLFNTDGELKDEIFNKITDKVGPAVAIVKAAEDYTAYGTKQIEELEHIVELYDFSATLKDQDIISAFQALNSDSMYIQWIDDTHALLVLGSHTQALKAIELSSSFIKVRPMSAASKMALEKAYRFDLKPAMKRPQTNLQTVRRLITSHLGEKNRVSKEQNAREKEDIRIAKELKRKTRQNERDAWEGNLRSAIN